MSVEDGLLDLAQRMDRSLSEEVPLGRTCRSCAGRGFLRCLSCSEVGTSEGCPTCDGEGWVDCGPCGAAGALDIQAQLMLVPRDLPSPAPCVGGRR